LITGNKLELEIAATGKPFKKTGAEMALAAFKKFLRFIFFGLRKREKII
jgi:hypothetical protein